MNLDDYTEASANTSPVPAHYFKSYWTTKPNHLHERSPSASCNEGIHAVTASPAPKVSTNSTRRTGEALRQLF